jgi:hypothetical protein
MEHQLDATITVLLIFKISYIDRMYNLPLNKENQQKE